MSNLTFAPRGQGYYDAFASTPDTAIVSNSVGPVTAVTGVSRDAALGFTTQSGTYGDHDGLTTTAQTNSKIIIFNPGSSDDVVGVILEPIASSGSLHVHQKPIKCTAFQDMGPVNLPTQGNSAEQDPATNHPLEANPARRTESIPLRGSLRIRNVTEQLNVGGTVRFLRYNGSLNVGWKAWHRVNASADPPASHEQGVFSAADATTIINTQAYFDLRDMVRDAERTRHMSGRELVEGVQSNTYPSDFIRSHEFRDDDGFWECVKYTKFCSLIILIDDFTPSGGQNNSYELNVKVHRAARYAPGTLLHNLAETLVANSALASQFVAREATGEHVSKIRQIANFAHRAITSPQGQALVRHGGRMLADRLTGNAATGLRALTMAGYGA